MGACAADRHQARRAAGSHLRPGVDSDHRRGGSKCGHIHAIANGTFLAGGNGRDDVAKAFFAEPKGKQMTKMRPFARTVLCGHNYPLKLSTVRTMHVGVTLSHTKTFGYPFLEWHATNGEKARGRVWAVAASCVAERP